MSIFAHRQAILLTIVSLIMVLGVGGYILKKNVLSPALKIAVLDGDRLKREATAFETVKHLMESELEKVRVELQPMSESMESDYRSLRSEKNSAKAQKKKEDFDIKQAEFERLIVQRKEYIQKIDEHLTNLVNNAVLEVTQEIAKQNSIDVIHNRFVEDKLLVFYYDKKLDLTDDVVSMLNDRLKNIRIPEELKKK